MTDADGSFSYWRAPAGTVGSVDLRPLRDVGTYGFFTTDQPISDSNYQYLGDDLNLIAKGGADAWNSLLGINVSGGSVLDLLWNTLTLGADPDGDRLTLPIMPTHTGQMELHLGGHSLIRKAMFTGESDPAWPLVQAVIQKNVKAIRDIGNGKGKGKKDEERAIDLAGKYVEAMRIKLKLPDEKKLIPASVTDVKSKKPTTTISDDFNRDNQTGLGTSSAGWSWSSVSGHIDIVSNAAGYAATSLVVMSSRADYDLSSSDHFSQIKFTSIGQASGRGAGPTVRFASGANTYYWYKQDTYDKNPNNNIFKCVAGTLTLLGTGTDRDASDNDVAKISADGSTISIISNGTLQEAITDTAISSGTRGGLAMQQGSIKWNMDDFLAEDLVAAGIKVPIVMHYRRMMAA